MTGILNKPNPWVRRRGELAPLQAQKPHFPRFVREPPLPSALQQTHVAGPLCHTRNDFSDCCRVDCSAGTTMSKKSACHYPQFWNYKLEQFNYTSNFRYQPGLTFNFLKRVTFELTMNQKNERGTH